MHFPFNHSTFGHYPTTPIFKPKKNYQALHSIIKPSYETKQDKGFQGKKKKKTLEREIENERGPSQLQLPEIYSNEGEKKNSIIERDIKILPYLINKGGWLKCTASCRSIIIG